MQIANQPIRTEIEKDQKTNSFDNFGGTFGCELLMRQRLPSLLPFDSTRSFTSRSNRLMSQLAKANVLHLPLPTFIVI